MDRFQREAIRHVKAGHSVLVSAPTGSGKTLIAERVIEECIKRDLGIIYTSPIKALSNQKFRDFSKLYENRVGIVTGDVSLNPDAQILIMTTEIFRNRLLDGSQRMVEHGWIIFDEIHYLDDPERGTVWEESIMQLPPHMKILALSATVPNAEEIARWISSIHQTPIYIVEEKNRPVPLKFFYQCNNKILNHINELNRFRSHFHGGFRRTRRQPMRRHPSHLTGNRLSTLINYISERGYIPCLYFTFSRKRCENLAHKLSDCNFLTGIEREKVVALFKSLLERFDLVHERSALEMSELIKRGIAFHHAGMLPTLKEVVERLFTSRLIKVMFTTETFALGVNMPARSVIFDELRKTYGTCFSELRVRDFYQMAGRAGRRGMDDCGFVFSRVNPNFITIEKIKNIIFAEPEEVISQFNNTYATVLHLYERLKDNLFKTYPRSLHYFQSSPGERRKAQGLLMRKVDLLKEMGYIAEGKLTEKGRLASCLYGYELPLAELYQQGYLDELSVTGLNILISGLVFESRKNQAPPKLSRIAMDIKKVARLNSLRIFSLEKKFKVYPYSKKPHFHAAPAIEAFSQGMDFSKLYRITDIDEGELVRVFRMVIQVLRELCQAPTITSTLKQKARGAIGLINRDVIDAEKQLREG
ncbi:DEAD/DEAH box helicase [candidate division NPL-UPA2 bacterium]|nr:DEAD/DEAH box helicase [candidate division NPL-UPA2 bacterium]